MRSRITSGVGIAVAAVLTFGLLTVAFTPSEKTTIQQMKQRMSRIEATHAADVTAMQLEVDFQSQRISSLEDAVDGITADIETLDANDQTVQRSLDILDEGLKGLVAEDGPLAQIDGNLAELQTYVWDRVPAVALTDILPLVACDTTTCTVDVEWNSEPPATGQVEWGPTEEYGNLTRKQETPLAYHKQRIGTFPADGTVYHFRILAELPEGGSAATEGTVTVG